MLKIVIGPDGQPVIQDVGERDPSKSGKEDVAPASKKGKTAADYRNAYAQFKKARVSMETPDVPYDEFQRSKDTFNSTGQFLREMGGMDDKGWSLGIVPPALREDPLSPLLNNLQSKGAGRLTGRALFDSRHQNLSDQEKSDLLSWLHPSVQRLVGNGGSIPVLSNQSDDTMYFRGKNITTPKANLVENWEPSEGFFPSIAHEGQHWADQGLPSQLRPSAFSGPVSRDEKKNFSWSHHKDPGEHEARALLAKIMEAHARSYANDQDYRDTVDAAGFGGDIHPMWLGQGDAGAGARRFQDFWNVIGAKTFQEAPLGDPRYLEWIKKIAPLLVQASGRIEGVQNVTA